ncbi:sensor histidine kinase [Paenibacillus athensensis]|uniref:Signal transduction histidine kinase internal region domain-containing protein n=1 Tax=Paenibacillus athensensis TaxID=1967502 RepID=A0A4Y8Q5E4_9BACL|nr:sensor histidine kinase [Paenibacillus athensensis]MCD1259490.1 sensor histidine kinase [Paenibacillus athensensis]
MRRWFSNLKLIQKLLILMMIFILVPLLCLDWFISQKVESTATDQMGSATLELMKMNHVSVDRILSDLDEATEKIMISQEVQSIANVQNENDSLERHKSLDSYINRYTDNQVRYMFLLPESAKLFSFFPFVDYSNNGVFYAEHLSQFKWYQAARDAKGKGILVIEQMNERPVPHNSTMYIRDMNSIYTGDSTLGVLIVANLELRFQTLLRALNTFDNMEIYLLNEQNQVLSNVGESMVGAVEQIPEELDHIGSGVFIAKEKKHSWLYAVDRSEESKTSILVKIPLDSLTGQQQVLQKLIHYLMIVYVIILLLVSSYFIRSFLKPLSRLARLTFDYEPGEAQRARYAPESRNEILLLNNKLIEMTNRLDRMIHEKYDLELRQKEIELSFLHSQINPHLLYNTLDSIYWRTIVENAEHSSEMIKDLSMLLRIGLSRGKMLITINEEMAHTEAYIRLQLKRYDFQFEVFWDIEEAARQQTIPKVVLQPLVENAIIHGIKNMENDGKLWISVQIVGEVVEIAIEDNGYKRPEPEMLNAIINEQYKNKGYGIINVHKRIRLHFGEPYGLSYRLGQHEGIRAVITIPNHTKPDE